MMTQEDGYVEIRVNLYSRLMILKWIRPVVIKKIRLLFDTYAMMVVSRNSDLDFTDIEHMDPEEYMAWMVYGGYVSYKSLRNKRPRISIEEAVQWVKGMLAEDRKKVLETLQLSKEIGQIADSYQKARNKYEGPEGEADVPKKVQAQGSEQQS